MRKIVRQAVATSIAEFVLEIAISSLTMIALLLTITRIIEKVIITVAVFEILLTTKMNDLFDILMIMATIITLITTIVAILIALIINIYSERNITYNKNRNEKIGHRKILSRKSIHEYICSLKICFGKENIVGPIFEKKNKESRKTVVASLLIALIVRSITNNCSKLTSLKL